MVDKIFLVKDRPTGYEEESNILGFALSREEAQGVIAREINYYIDACVIVANLDRLRACFEEGLGESKLEPLVEIPRWKAGIAEKDITNEMRDERNKLITKNEEIKARNSDVFKARYEAVWTYLKPKLIEELKGRENSMKYIAINEHYGSIGLNAHLHESEPFFIEEVNRF